MPGQDPTWRRPVSEALSFRFLLYCWNNLEINSYRYSNDIFTSDCFFRICVFGCRNFWMAGATPTLTAFRLKIALAGVQKLVPKSS